MAPTLRKGKANMQRLATTMRSSEGSGRRRFRMGALLLVALLATFAVKSLPSVAASSPTRSTRTSTSAAAPQPVLRSLVLRLSQCLSTLVPNSQRALLLRAGIGPSRPQSRNAVARALHVSVGREAGIEREALHTLQAAAWEGRCASTPALIHVPAGNRLVLVDALLTAPHRPVRGTHRSDPVSVSDARVTRLLNGTAKVSFALWEGNNHARIHTLTVSLPTGLTFSHSRKQLQSGTVIRTGRKRLRLTARIAHGKLTIRLKTPASRVRVTITSPAITLSGALAHKVRTREIKVRAL